MAKLPEVPVAHLEFEHSPLEDAVIRHKNKLILVSVLAVVGSLGYFGNKLWTEHKQSVAALAFTRADTVGELREVAAQNPGQPGGGSALLDASRLLTKEGRNKEAMEELQKFITNYSSHELADLAKFRLADLKLQEGSLQDAAAGFQEIAKNPSSPYASLALIRAGDILWQEGKTEEARRLFEEAVTKTGGNQVAMERVKQVKLAAPTLIDYVPEPAPAAPAPGGLPSIDALNGTINTPGLMGDDPTGLGGEAPLLPPPALPGLPPSIQVAPLAPAPPPVPDPVPATPPPAAAPAVPTPPAAPAPVVPATPAPAVETPAVPAAPPPAVETPAPAPPPAPAPVPPPAAEQPATPPPAAPAPAPATPPPAAEPAPPAAPDPAPAAPAPEAPPAAK